MALDHLRNAEFVQHAAPASLAEAGAKCRIVEDPQPALRESRSVADPDEIAVFARNHQFAIARNVGRHDGNTGNQGFHDDVRQALVAAGQ